MRLFAALLFVATTAGAQLVEDRELTYGPFEPGPRDRSFAIAVAPHGMLLAWSEVDPDTQLAVIHTGLLDFDAQLIGPIHKLPAAITNVHATTPAVATDGTSFFVAWVERHRYTLDVRHIAGIEVDAHGRPGADTRRLGPAPAGAPPLMWDGLAFKVLDGASRFPFATPQANGWIDWIVEPPKSRCGFGCYGLPMFVPGRNVLQWSILTANWIRTGRVVEPDENVTIGAPAVAATEDDLLVVWSTGRNLRAVRVIDGQARPIFSRGHQAGRPPSIALAESLAVFGDGDDVYGSVIVGEQFGDVFPISTGLDRDSHPRVYLVGENRYLVTYLRNDSILAGRFVTLALP